MAMPPPPAIGDTSENRKGTLALVFGIISFFCCGIVFGILAIVFGVQGRNAAAAGRATNGGMATAGLILGIIGLIANTIGSAYIYTNNWS